MPNLSDRQGRVLFCVSGSIATYKACFAISRLVQDGHEVQVAATEAALRFVGAATFEGLTGRPVFGDVFEAGRRMDHIHLARWADVAILAPASADAINGLAQGLARDAVGTLFLAWPLAERPWLVAPAMNHAMLAHPATQAAIAKLGEWGVRVLDSGRGHQACGETGDGRLLEPDELVAQVTAALAGRPAAISPSENPENCPARAARPARPGVDERQPGGRL